MTSGKMLSKWLVPTLFFFAIPSVCGASEQGRFAIILGNNRGASQNVPLDYAESDAKKVYKTLTELGGFSKENTRLLVGADVDQAWRAAYSIDKQIAERKRKTGQKNLLFLFFSGHAEGDGLEFGNGSLRFSNLLEYLKSSAADVRIAVIDSCKSGRFVSLKNSDQQNRNRFLVSDEIRSKGYAIITSSAYNELSQESAEIRSAYFTHYLVSALRGAGDKSGDGKVTLGEAYDYAYTKTLVRTSGTIAGTQHPMYEFQLEGRGDIVLTYPGIKGGATLNVKLPESGRLLLLDDLGGHIITETEVVAGKTTQVPVSTGKYIAYLLTPDNHVRRSRTTVANGQTVQLGIESFETVELTQTVAKGGLFLRSADSSKKADYLHTVSVGGMWRKFPLEGGISSWGAAVDYRLLTRSGWQPAARFNWTSCKDTGVSTGYNTLGLLVGGGYVWPFNKLALRLEALAGYEYLIQSPLGGTSRSTSGFNYMGVFGIDFIVDSLVIAAEGAAGGRVFQVLDEGWEHRADILGIISLGWRWEV